MVNRLSDSQLKMFEFVPFKWMQREQKRPLCTRQVKIPKMQCNSISTTARAVNRCVRNIRITFIEFRRPNSTNKMIWVYCGWKSVIGGNAALMSHSHLFTEHFNGFNRFLCALCVRRGTQFCNKSPNDENNTFFQWHVIYPSILPVWLFVYIYE